MEDLVPRLHHVIDQHLAGFEDRYGYPPGDHHVTPATDTAGIDALKQEFGESLPTSVARLFGTVTEVSLPDLWNGYFIGPASWSIGLHQAAEPRAVAMDDAIVEVLIIGSDGGGSLYALALDGTEAVFSLPPAGIERGVWTRPSNEPTRKLAGSLNEFLSIFVAQLEDYVLHGGPAPFS